MDNRAGRGPRHKEDIVMSVLEEMEQFRESLIQEDRRYAMQALTKKLYYEATT